MVKECPVKLSNDYCTVVSFDGVEIQFPSIHRRSATVFVMFKDGKYSIVDRPANKERQLATERKPAPAKKKTQRKPRVEKKSEPIVTDNIE